MAKFVYIGGLTPTADEVNGTKMPAETTAFGIEFIKGQEVDVTRDLFKSDGAHRHALAKLATNKFFKAVAEEVPVEMVGPEPDKTQPVRPKLGVNK